MRIGFGEMEKKINIVYDHKMNWILARLAKSLVYGIPSARDVDYEEDYLLNSPDTIINYYVNLRRGHRYNTKAIDVGFFDHKEVRADDYNHAARLDHVICMAPQYQRHLQSMGVSTSLVIQPTDTKIFTPKLILGWCGKFSVPPYKQNERKGRDLLMRVGRLPFVDLRTTDGKILEKDLPDWYRNLDYVIVTSRFEGGPMCLTEGLASGKKIIIPKTVGIAEMFPEGIIDYPAGDFESLEKILWSLFDEKNRLAKMVSKYTWENWISQHVKIFNDLLGKKEKIKTKELERAIVVISTPEIEEITRYTLPHIKNYAERCRAELIVWDDCPPEYQHPKYRLMGLKNVNAKRILHLDADCCPKPNAPDIFDEYPEGFIYSWDEMEIRTFHTVQGFQKTIDNHAKESVVWDRHWWNPGVMLLDKKHLKIFEMPKWDVTDKEYLWFGNTVKNQPWINWRIRKCGEIVKPLDRRFNCITSLLDTKPNDAYILHFGAEKIPDAHSRKISMAEKFSSFITNSIIDNSGKNKYKCALVTVVSGSDAIKLHEITGPFMEKYAHKHGYDFKIFRSPEKKDFWPSPSWWKLESVKLFNEEYDVVVFIDNDIFIKPEAPPICEEVPRGMFGAFNSYTIGAMKKAGCECNVSCRKWLSAMDVSDVIPQNQPFFINAGMWVCWKEAKDILRCDNPKEFDKYVEQHQVNLNLWRNPHLYYQLDHKWNFGHLHVMANYVEALSDNVYFVHLNGVSVSERCSLLTDFISDLNKKGTPSNTINVNNAVTIKPTKKGKISSVAVKKSAARKSNASFISKIETAIKLQNKNHRGTKKH